MLDNNNEKYEPTKEDWAEYYQYQRELDNESKK